MEYEDCSMCESPEQPSMLDHEGRCVPCAAVDEAEDEIPEVAVQHLMSMAVSRHPSVCNKDAPNFREVLVENGFLPEGPN